MSSWWAGWLIRSPVFSVWMLTYALWVVRRLEKCYLNTVHLPSNETLCCGLAFLLHDNSALVPLKPKTFENGFQSAIFYNLCLLSGLLNWQTTKPIKALTPLMLIIMLGVATLMLMLAQVNAFCSSHDQSLIEQSTVHPKQVEYDDSLLRQRWVVLT